MLLGKQALAALRACMRRTANLGMNIGAAVNAGIAEHGTCMWCRAGRATTIL
jgi:hypothetical protein